MQEDILQKIGLTNNESKIYLALLNRRNCLVSQLVAETKLNRTHIYDRLEKLIDKGLVSYIIMSEKKYFNAVSPNKLLQMIEEEEKEILKRKKEFLSILPNVNYHGLKPRGVYV